MIVEHRRNVSRFLGSYDVLTETGGLLRVAVKLMMACASQNVNVFVTPRPIADKRLNLLRDYVPLVNLIGVYFQIRDDYMNLQNSEVSFMSVASVSRPYPAPVRCEQRFR